jgi:hypothetical protein
VKKYEKFKYDRKLIEDSILLKVSAKRNIAGAPSLRHENSSPAFTVSRDVQPLTHKENE